MTNTGKQNVILIFLAFLLCGALHVALWSVDFADLVSQLFCGIAVITWEVSVQKRVTDRRILRLLQVIAFVFLLYLLMQTVNYRFAQDQPAIRRYAWYAYYASMMIISVLIFFISRFCYADTRKKMSAAEYVLPAAGCLLSVALMCNDLHFLAIRFKTEEMLPSSPATYGWLYYLYYAVLGTLLLTALITVIRKHRLVQKKNRWFLLSLPVLLLFLLYALDVAGLAIKINGHKMWQMGETFSFCLIAHLELLIGYGLIPANVGYERLFAGSDISASILDRQGEVRYASLGMQYPFRKDEDTLVLRHPISGGTIEWAVDIAPLNLLNHSLEETVKKIEARNAYLSTENRVRQEKAEAETRNRIYDRITQIVKPQLDQISGLLDEKERPFDERLRDISVFCAYIKRRSNMELLSVNSMLSSDELTLAISESLSYVQLKGIPAALTSSETQQYPADMIIAAYEQVERVIENCLDTLKALVIHVNMQTGQISVRIIVNSEDITVPLETVKNPERSFTMETSATKNGSDMILAFTFREGGMDS